MIKKKQPESKKKGNVKQEEASANIDSTPEEPAKELSRPLTEEELYLENLYRDAAGKTPLANPNAAPSFLKLDIPLADPAKKYNPPERSQAVPKKSKAKVPTQPEIDKTTEELYLESLYKTKEGDDVPEGTIPLQRSALQNSSYVFRSINTKQKQATPLQVAGSCTRLVSTTYFIGGLLMFLNAVGQESVPAAAFLNGHITTALGQTSLRYGFWVLLFGLAVAVAGIPVARKETYFIKRRTLWLICVAAGCLVTATLSLHCF